MLLFTANNTVDNTASGKLDSVGALTASSAGPREVAAPHPACEPDPMETCPSGLQLLGDLDSFLSEIVTEVEGSNLSISPTSSLGESGLGSSLGSAFISSGSAVGEPAQHDSFDPSILAQIAGLGEMDDVLANKHTDSAPKRRKLRHTWGRSEFHPGAARELLTLDPPAPDMEEPSLPLPPPLSARRPDVSDDAVLDEHGDFTLSVDCTRVPPEPLPGDQGIVNSERDEASGAATTLLSLPQTADMFLGPIITANNRCAAFVFRDSPKTPLQYREAHVSEDGGPFDVKAWALTAKVSVKERWQIFAATEHLVFSAAQNAASIGCWAKVDDFGGEAGSSSGRINLTATETITAYPHQMQAFNEILVIGGRDCHYDDIKHHVPTAMIVLFDLFDEGRRYRQRTTLKIDDFDAIAQLSGNGTTCAMSGFPRDAVSYDKRTGKRQVMMEKRKFPILLLDMATWDRSHDRKLDAHDDVITRVEMRASTLFTASFDNTVKTWSVPPAGVVTPLRIVSCCLPTSVAPIRGLSKGFFSASLDGVIRRWSESDAEHPTDQINLVDESTHLVTPLSMAHFGSMLLTAHFGKCVYDPDQFCGIRLWSLDNGRPLAESEQELALTLT
eukprot:m.362765 g.362765  ORF g.362765 m.362765 type:complete len:615 (+) comp16652_c2_seq3:4030-5874(+)